MSQTFQMTRQSIFNSYRFNAEEMIPIYNFKLNTNTPDTLIANLSKDLDYPIESIEEAEFLGRNSRKPKRVNTYNLNRLITAQDHAVV